MSRMLMHAAGWHCTPASLCVHHESDVPDPRPAKHDTFSCSIGKTSSWHHPILCTCMDAAALATKYFQCGCHAYKVLSMLPAVPTPSWFFWLLLLLLLACSSDLCTWQGTVCLMSGMRFCMASADPCSHSIWVNCARMPLWTLKGVSLWHVSLIAALEPTLGKGSGKG